MACFARTCATPTTTQPLHNHFPLVRFPLVRFPAATCERLSRGWVFWHRSRPYPASWNNAKALASDSVAHTRAQSILRIRSTASDAKRPTPLTPLPSPRPLSNLVLFRPPPVRFPTTTRQNGGRVSPDDRREEPPKAGSMRGADLPRPKVLCKRSAAHRPRKGRISASRW